MYDFLVVGAGLAGCTMAERLAGELGATVLVVDKRHNVAGNAYDPIDASGLRRHAFGPHVFHSNSPWVVAYLSRFTAWRHYEHRVLARVNDQLVPVPINRTTINRLYGLQLSPSGIAEFLASRAEKSGPVKNSERAILSSVGRELYELFFRGYTRKQWGLDPSELDASVCGRIPTRSDDDDRYFSDTFQAMPRDGFEAMCRRMLAHPGIEIALGASFEEIESRVRFDRIVYTGPIDEFFEFRHGKLPYRSLRFEFETLPVERYQRVAVINEPSESVPFTRTTEHKYLTGQSHPHTVISREYPAAQGDPYYPIPRPENRAQYAKYAKLAVLERNVSFVGRLAEYRYYNMDQVVASALRAFEDIAKDWTRFERIA